MYSRLKDRILQLSQEFKQVMLFIIRLLCQQPQIMPARLSNSIRQIWKNRGSGRNFVLLEILRIPLKKVCITD